MAASLIIILLHPSQHPHVVGLIDEFYVRDRLFIVMEFVPCNLLELLEAEPGGMNREAVRLIMFQLCSVMSFIHSKNVSRYNLFTSLLKKQLHD